MNVEVLMEAINGINEKYIIEASQMKKTLWFEKNIWKAACVILVVIAMIFVWNVPERYEVIWAEKLNVEELNEAVNKFLQPEKYMEQNRSQFIQKNDQAHKYIDDLLKIEKKNKYIYLVYMVSSVFLVKVKLYL